ncbi:RHS repeat domain-containing protein [Aquimarina sp. 2304DJ70-9]|uniref:RHS repeat domain-containing protein n=1 Tax=Aquimarina penaris TaxID=3231044 RepID=UPI00346231CC
MTSKKIYLTSIFLILYSSVFLAEAQHSRSYNYDANGNMMSDSNKAISSITYNILNLPKTIIFEDGRKIEYTYSAAGIKLSQKAHRADSSLEQNKNYLKNIVYINNQLEFFNHSQGYTEQNPLGEFEYTYHHLDHLGNIRLSFGQGHNNAEIKETKDYYPFGLRHQKENNLISGRAHPYGFNGKEEQPVFDLDWHDFGARMYDATLARWNGIDPLAENYIDLSTYSYVANNPIRFIDPDGMQIAEGSLKDWNTQKNAILAERTEVQKTLKNTKPTKANKKKIAELEYRNAALSTSLATMDLLEQSSQVYRIDETKGQVGTTRYDKDSDEIVISYEDTENFVHELTHGGQYETGEIFFDKEKGNSLLSDLHDEADAYRAQYAFSPESFKKTFPGRDIKHITAPWVGRMEVKGPNDKESRYLYKNYLKVRVNIRTSKSTLKRLFPGAAKELKNLPENEPLKKLTDIKYKQ